MTASTACFPRFGLTLSHCVFCRKQVHPCLRASYLGGGEGRDGGGFLLLFPRSAPESLRAGYLLVCSVYHFREVLCVEFLYCRIVTGSADGKVGILSMVFHCLFVFTVHRGGSNFLVRKQEASKRLLPQNRLFSVTVISRVHLCIVRLFLYFLSPPFSAAYLEPLEWRLSSDYSWKQQKWCHHHNQGVWWQVS